MYLISSITLFVGFGKIMNESICHDPKFPPMTTKLPNDAPKFKGKLGENTTTHITTYNLCCSSNSLVDDSMWLLLFLCTLIRYATKSYIELDRESYSHYYLLT